MKVVRGINAGMPFNEETFPAGSVGCKADLK